MKKIVLIVTFALTTFLNYAQEKVQINSPDQKLTVYVYLDAAGMVSYNVDYLGKAILESSPLGLVSNVSDFSRDLKLTKQQTTSINESYDLNRTKKSHVNYVANEVVLSYETPKKEKLDIVFRVSNNDIALKYRLAQNGDTARCVIERELTGFNFPQFTTTFLTPQATPLIGWKQTKPSYEEEYVPDEPVGTPSKYHVGYTFPGLFHVGTNGWALVSETGVTSLYCGSKLSEGTKDGLYTIAFPEPGENNGVGSAKPAISLPGETPWRTITVGDNLKPIVETTIPFDVVKPLYTPSIDYKFGRSTWSWLLWQDNSINYADQKTFIDLSATLGFELVLIDGLWDNGIGYDKIPELVAYARSKNVGVCLWYNSNGFWNDAPQGPRQKMNTSVARKKEMAWMKSMGVKGIKVDFFGGDKQETLQLYEDILSDANDYGLAVIFHGCTLPRGWERMYPNFASAEAVLASENLIFTQHANDFEAYNASLHPFIRNSVASMDFGPVLLNKRHNKTNDNGTVRKTTEVFQVATSILFQSPIQNYGVTPNNLQDCPPALLDLLKAIPTTWDETVFLDGYPGKYCVLARRHGDKWYITGVNAEKQVKKLTLKLPMVGNAALRLYTDKPTREAQLQTVRLNKKGEISVDIQPDGGIVIVN
jgi:hypothetical protein